MTVFDLFISNLSKSHMTRDSIGESVQRAFWKSTQILGLFTEDSLNLGGQNSNSTYVLCWKYHMQVVLVCLVISLLKYVLQPKIARKSTPTIQKTSNLKKPTRHATAAVLPLGWSVYSVH